MIPNAVSTGKVIATTEGNPIPLSIKNFSSLIPEKLVSCLTEEGYDKFFFFFFTEDDSSLTKVVSNLPGASIMEVVLVDICISAAMQHVVPLVVFYNEDENRFDFHFLAIEDILKKIFAVSISKEEVVCAISMPRPMSSIEVDVIDSAARRLGITATRIQSCGNVEMN